MGAWRGTGAAAAGLSGWLLMGLVGVACREAGAPRGTAPPVKNVLLVSLDTLRADRVGARRDGVPLTPRLDAFAARAARFTNCRSVSGHTLASHKSILSGRLPPSYLDAFSSGRDEQARLLDPGAYYRAAFRRWPFPSVASRLREAGVATAAFTDGIYMEPRYGLGEGFEPYASRKLGLAGQAARAREWLEEVGSRPFFLFVHTYDAHCPYDPPPRFLRLFGHECAGRLRFAGTCGKSYFNRLELTSDEVEHVALHYDAGVRRVDEELGGLLDWLDSTGRLSDTAVIVTSDHGESLGERAFVGHGELYDNQLHVPLVVFRPHQAPVVRDAPVSGVDVAATVLDLLLARVPEGLDGESLLPLLQGAGDVSAFAERVRVAAVTVNEGGLGRTRLRKIALLAPLGLKLIADPDAGTAEWYDLATDPGESRPLPDRPSRDQTSLREVASRRGAGPLRGLGEGGEDLHEEGLPREAVESLRALGYVED